MFRAMESASPSRFSRNRAVGRIRRIPCKLWAGKDFPRVVIRRMNEHRIRRITRARRSIKPERLSGCASNPP
jgi:hypothetical protein